MAIQLPRQIVTRVAPVIGGGVPPSGNLPVHSPFTGGFRPHVPVDSGPIPVRVGLAQNAPSVSATIFHPMPFLRRFFQ